MRDDFTLFIENEIRIAEAMRENSNETSLRMLFTGQVAAFKSAVVVYERIKTGERPAMVKDTPDEHIP
jgi:hypothetical protein